MANFQALLFFNLIVINGIVQIRVKIPVLDTSIDVGNGSILEFSSIDIGLRLRDGKGLLNISLPLVD